MRATPVNLNLMLLFKCEHLVKANSSPALLCFGPGWIFQSHPLHCPSLPCMAFQHGSGETLLFSVVKPCRELSLVKAASWEEQTKQRDGSFP